MVIIVATTGEAIATNQIRQSRRVRGLLSRAYSIVSHFPPSRRGLCGTGRLITRPFYTEGLDLTGGSLFPQGAAPIWGATVSRCRQTNAHGRISFGHDTGQGRCR
jgi:hypothetical protein